jgi:hypothetical protein
MTSTSVVVDRRMRPWSGPRERRSGEDRRQQQIPVAVERRRGGERRTSARSSAELWERRSPTDG